MKRMIILLLVLSCFRISYAEDSGDKMDLQVKKQIESKFLNGDAPSRYYSNILIQLKGKPTKEDSLIFKELVDTLNILIIKWDVYLVLKGTSNLVVEINNPETEKGMNKILTYRDNGEEIVKRTVVLYLPSDLDFITRKKTIYYYLIRSLVNFKSEQSQSTPISGSIFTESSPDRINFLPIDFEIVRELYSSKYERNLNKSIILNQAGSSIRWYNDILIILINLFAILLPLMCLLIIYQKGFLKKHNYKFGPFFKQGLLAFMAFFIYFGIKIVLSILLFTKTLSVVPTNIFIILILILIGIVSILFIYVIERYILIRKDNFMLEIIVPLIATMIVPVFFTILLLFIFERYSGNHNALQYSFIIFPPILSFTLSMGIARAFYIFTSIKSENIIRKKDIELAHMNELHKQAELQSLRAKINPHFLYNALNSIASLAATDARKTEQMALALSDFFKYAINREQKQLNTLSEELNAIRTYLEIEKVRFGDRLSFEIDCPEDLLNIQIPQLLIQPLVENAIKHGLSQITENGLIRILVSKEESQLKIRVYDNGPAFPEGPLSGFGIQNTQERIALLYGAKATINWQNGTEKYIELCLPIAAEVV